MRTIMHVDVNSAYLAWEAVDRLQHGASLDLRTVPSVVGGDEASRHGIVLAKSNLAKKYNIQTGETLHAARMKCPNLVIVPPRYEVYMRCSKAMREILAEFSDTVQVFSVDECFLDYTGVEGVKGSPIEAADEIRRRMRTDLGFTVNVGISSNKLLAKMAGELIKPDRTLTLYPEELQEKLWPLPIEELYMVGRKTAPKLREIGIQTIGDLARTEPAVLQYRLKSFGMMLYHFAHGIEASDVKPVGPTIKGIGNSTTTSFDVEDEYHASLVLLSLTESVGSRLRAGDWCAKQISLSLRDKEFQNQSMQTTLADPTDCTNTIFAAVQRLFKQLWKGQPLRHIGIRTTQLTPSDGLQLSLFDPDSAKQHALDTAVDELRQRFGKRAVYRGSFLHSGIRPVTGGVGDDEYQMMSSLL